MAVTTWNNSDKDADVTVTGGSLVATITGTISPIDGSIRATTSKDSGKRMFEVSIAQTGSVSRIGVGAILASAGINSYIGDDDPVAFVNTGGSKPSGSGGAVWGNADVISAAFDFDNLLAYFAKNGTWLIGDPDAATDGLSFSAGSYFPAFGASGVQAGSTSGTLNTGATAFTAALPAGYSAWDAQPSTASMLMMF